MKREVLNMGYRSDVAYVIRFGTVEQRDTFIELVNHRNDKHLKQALTECETNYEQPLITFFIENVKWYPDYPEVKAHDQLMEWAVELYEEAGYRMVQVGEDGQEEEDQGGDCDDLYDYIYTRHSLEIEFPQVKQEVKNV